MEYYKYLREFVGNRPIILPGSVGLVFDDSRKILLEKRLNGDYGLPGGFMDLKESFEETLIRELEEETSLQAHDLKFIKIYSGERHHVVLENGDEMYVITAAFEVVNYSGKPVRNSEESLELGFFDLEDLPQPINKAHHRIIQDFIQGQ